MRHGDDQPQLAATSLRRPTPRALGSVRQVKAPGPDYVLDVEQQNKKSAINMGDKPSPLLTLASRLEMS